MPRDYFVATAHFFVPYRLVWSDWFEFMRQCEPYYDVWCDG